LLLRADNRRKKQGSPNEEEGIENDFLFLTGNQYANEKTSKPFCSPLERVKYQASFAKNPKKKGGRPYNKGK